jgi:hypothetical protein
MPVGLITDAVMAERCQKRSGDLEKAWSTPRFDGLQRGRKSQMSERQTLDRRAA